MRVLGFILAYMVTLAIGSGQQCPAGNAVCNPDGDDGGVCTCENTGYESSTASCGACGCPSGESGYCIFVFIVSGNPPSL